MTFLLVCCGLALAFSSGCTALTEDPSEHSRCEGDPKRLEEHVGSTQEEISNVSCKMSSATGYKSGKPFKIQVVRIDGESVEWKTANAYIEMAKAAAKDGVQLRVVSGFRTMAEQQYLYNCYKTCSCNGCNLAAVPGTSNHQSGHALDLNTSSSGVYGWLGKHAAKFGFARTVPSEIWHWEWWGKDDGSGPCNGDTLEAKLVKKWSNAQRARGKKADFVVCAGDDFKLALTFKNKGSAVWRDVKGRGDGIGSDVFLVTQNGKTDKLTGKKRFSVRLNDNSRVRGDHAAKSCVSKDGCRKTRFTSEGMKAHAPSKPGIYGSSWRLRDYSKVWGKSKPFGPKVKVRVKVLACKQSKKDCGCRVWCSDGKSHDLDADGIDTAAKCKTVAQAYCGSGASHVGHDFVACASDPATQPASDPTSDPASDPAPDTSDPTDPTADSPAEDSPLVDEQATPDDSDSNDDNAWSSDDSDDTADPTELEPDDADFDDEGFDGDEQGPDRGGVEPAEEACSVARPGPGGTRGGLAAIGAAILALGAMCRRRRFRSPFRGAGAALAAVGLAALSLSGCASADPAESVGEVLEPVSAPGKAHCKIAVSGRGTKSMEDDYLPHVVTCENGGAKLEALKAQAIAARSVAYYAIETSGSICDGQGCQVYGCGATPSELVRRAVRETSGMILTHGGVLTYGFYVAGDPGASPPSCKDGSSATSSFVTYNAGKTGKSIDQTSLGSQGSAYIHQNRGCMSQWGARCLDSKPSFDFMDILRFYYGSDIKVVQTQGSCVEPTRTLRAKLRRKWSSAKRFRGKSADYIACAGDEFRFAFTFKNTGSASWRDIKGRGKNVGNDVFLVTANGKPDKLTGKKRLSVRLNQNSHVRGDHASKECTKKGCRRTTFIEGGISATAPNKPGVYHSRWRLRDYSKAWKKSKGFGPKVQLSLEVLACKKPADCGCRVWCSNGKSHDIDANAVDSSADCKSVGKSVCSPAQLVSSSYTACSTGGVGGAGATEPPGSGSSDPNANDPADPAADPATDPVGDPATDPADDPAGDPAADPADDPANEWTTEEIEQEEYVEEEDDADWEDDGFDGNEDDLTDPAQDAGCSLAARAPGGRAVGWLALGTLSMLIAARRRSRARLRRGAAMVEAAVVAMVFVILFACMWAAVSIQKTKIEVMNDARALAWKKALNPCPGDGDVMTDLGNASTNADSDAPPSTSKADTFVRIKDQPGFTDSGYLKVDLTKKMTAPSLTGGQTYEMHGRMAMRCNEPKQQETGDHYFKLVMGVAILLYGLSSSF